MGAEKPESLESLFTASARRSLSHWCTQPFRAYAMLELRRESSRFGWERTDRRRAPQKPRGMGPLLAVARQLATRGCAKPILL